METEKDKGMERMTCCRTKELARDDEQGKKQKFTFEVLEMFESIERAGVAVGVVDAEGWEELKDLLLDGRVGRVEGRGQFGHILAVLDDIVESDSRIHDAAYRVCALDLQPRPIGLTFVYLALQLVPTFWMKYKFEKFSYREDDEL